MPDQLPAIAAGSMPDALAPVVERLCRAAATLSGHLARGSGLEGLAACGTSRNADGDAQTGTDLAADRLFCAELAGCGVRWYASEEQEEVVALDPAGSFALAIDPLDGSSNLDANLAVGTIFSVFPAADDGIASFLRPAREQVLAGYFIYGPRTELVLTWGEGTRLLRLDPVAGGFRPVSDALAIPPSAPEFAINVSNYRHWPRPIRAFVDDCLTGAEGPRATDFNMRWIASLVAEAHRILSRGGVFLYPEDRRPRYGRGRLRLLYECAPLAWVVEQAGGRATDGLDDLLDARPAGLHDRTPFVFGSRDLVARIASYHDLPQAEVSALFGQRGLFRT